MITKYAEIFCWKHVSSFCSAKATHIFSAKNIRILYIKSAKTVKEMTLNELVKLTTLWTTGPWLSYLELWITANPTVHTMLSNFLVHPSAKLNKANLPLSISSTLIILNINSCTPSGLFNHNSLDWSIFNSGCLVSSYYYYVLQEFKQWRPWSDATFCGIWSGSALFVNYPSGGLLPKGKIREIDVPGRFSAIFIHKGGTTSEASCLLSCTSSPFWKRSSLKRKNLLPFLKSGVYSFFSFTVDLFKREAKTIWQSCLPWKFMYLYP